MEKRLLLVFAITFLIILISQPLLKKYLPQTPETKPADQSQPQNQPVNPTPQAAAAGSTPTAVPVQGAKQAASEAEPVVENDLYKIRFTNRGGQVKSWVLKKFKDDKGQPLELVNATAAAKYGYPLSLWAYDEALRNKLLTVISDNPGCRAEDINSALGTRTPQIAQPLRRLVADRLVRTEGARRGTRYFAVGPTDVQNGRRPSATEAAVSADEPPA